MRERTFLTCVIELGQAGSSLKPGEPGATVRGAKVGSGVRGAQGKQTRQAKKKVCP